MKMKRNGLISFFIIVIGVSALVWSQRYHLDAMSESGIPRYGGTLTLGAPQGLAPMDPFSTCGTMSVSLLDVVFNCLMRVNANGELERDLVERWESDDGGKRFTFHLRRGVRFHDGEELTAADVVFTYRKHTVEGATPWSPLYRNVERWDALDRHTVRAVLREPDPGFLHTLGRRIAPERHYGPEGDVEALAGRRPIGSGPFRVERWDPDGALVLGAYRDYYEGRPRLDRIVVLPFPTVTANWTALMRGDVDVMMFLDPEDAEFTRRDPAFRVFSSPGPLCYAIFFNLDDPRFADERIRRAVASAINVTELIGKAAVGQGEPATGMFCPGSVVARSLPPHAGYDPAESLRLFKEAGWNLNESGVLSRDGKPFEFDMLVNLNDPVQQKIALVLRQDLNAVGVLMRLVSVSDEHEFFGRVWGGDCAVSLMGVLGFRDAERCDVVKEIWGKLLHTDVNRHFSAEAQESYRRARSAWDVEEREREWCVVANEVEMKRLAYFLYYPHVIHAARRRVRNVEPFLSGLTAQFFYLKDVNLEP